MEKISHNTIIIWRLLKITLILLPNVVAFSPAFGQILPFDYYSMGHGLPSNWITAIYQDSRGYIWIGGDGGLSVYDGIRFKSYGVTDGLPVGHVWCFYESRKSPGTIFIGTHGGGLSKLANDLITSISLGEDFADNVVSNILEDHDGVIWCGSSAGIYRVYGDSVAFFPTGVDSTSPAFITQTRDSTIWIGADQNLYRYEPESGKPDLVKWKTQPSAWQCMLEDRAGAIWLGATDGTVYKSDTERIIATRKLPYGNLRAILDDREGFLWFLTDKGVLRAPMQDFPEGEIIHYTSENGLQENDIQSGLIDHENNLWFGSQNRGLSKLSDRNIIRFPMQGQNLHSMNSTAVSSPEGRIFVASEEGLWEAWETAGGNWKKYLHDPQRAGLSGSLHAVGHAADGLLWVAFKDGGLCGYAISSKKGYPSELNLTSVLRPGKQLPEGQPIGFIIDQNDQLWYCIWQEGMAQIDLRTHKLRAVYGEKDSLTGGTVRAVCEDGDGNIWFGTFKGGIAVFKPDGDRYRFSHRLTPADGLVSDRIRSLVRRRNGEIWIGTRFNGICVYKDGRFENITSREGLLNDAIWALAEDEQGRMWIGSSAGLQYTDPDNPRRFHTHERLIGKQTGSVGVLATRQAAWQVTYDDLIVYEYGREKPVGAPPPIYITGLRVNGQDRSLDKSLKFAHDENFCVLKYSGISFKNGQSLRYRYRLLGLDDKWQEPTDQRVMTFASLKPGSYRFEVAAINADGVESAAPASISFTILRPLWLRWWFIALSLSLIAAAIVVFERIRVRRLLEIERIRSRIATDLHDDIGAGLTHIGLLSEVTLRKAGLLLTPSGEKIGQTESQNGRTTEELGRSLHKVGNIARELSTAMSDVVWSINPKHDSVEALNHRLSAFAHEICEAKDIDLQFEVDEHILKMRLNPEVRRNLLLIAKEALHNMAKYSGSSSVKVQIEAYDNEIAVLVEDKGKGFEMNDSGNGNGLINMRSRAEKSGGKCEINSKPGQGTCVKATIPFKS